MAYAATNSSTYAAPREGALTRFFRALARALDAQQSMEARRAQILRLNRMTDAELAQKGIKREDIARHVFSDLFYV